jgi:hypothetical protein
LIAVHVDAQVTVAAAALHAPDPLQPPAVQVLLSGAQLVCGSWPAGTLLHVPSDDGRLHCLQPPHRLLGVSQQTESTQLPDLHSPSTAHEVPSDLGPHWSLLHGVPPLHCDDDEHIAKQPDVPSQTYGSQSIGVGVTQFPAPSQVEADVLRLLMGSQLGALHVMLGPQKRQAPAPSQ